MRLRKVHLGQAVAFGTTTAKFFNIDAIDKVRDEEMTIELSKMENIVIIKQGLNHIMVPIVNVAVMVPLEAKAEVPKQEKKSVESKSSGFFGAKKS
jgi:hypothetical protein